MNKQRALELCDQAERHDQPMTIGFILQAIRELASDEDGMVGLGSTQQIKGVVDKPDKFEVQYVQELAKTDPETTTLDEVVDRLDDLIKAVHSLTEVCSDISRHTS